MPEADGREKQQAATERQRQRFAERGEFPRSRELTSAAMLCACAIVLVVRGPLLTQAMLRLMRGSLARLGQPLDAALLRLAMLDLARLVAPLTAACVATAIALNLLQRRGAPGFVGLSVDLARLSPGRGLARLFGLKAAASNLAAALLKTCILAAVLLWTWQTRLAPLVLHAPASLLHGMRQAGDLFETLLWRGLMTLLLLGAVDFGLAFWRLEQQMRMSTQEVRDESKESSGDPTMRGRRRKKHQELVRSRSLKEVPRADVVLVNPTHVAVALRYAAKDMQAPRVVAKGAEAMASRIRHIARKHGVPVVSQPPLARLLYAQVKVGHAIPVEMYKAVAVILAHVYRRRKGQP